MPSGCRMCHLVVKCHLLGGPFPQDLDCIWTICVLCSDRRHHKSDSLLPLVEKVLRMLELTHVRVSGKVLKPCTYYWTYGEIFGYPENIWISRNIWISGFADFRIFWYPDFRISGFPDIRISGFPDIRISGCPDVRISSNDGALLKAGDALTSMLAFFY